MPRGYRNSDGRTTGHPTAPPIRETPTTRAIATYRQLTGASDQVIADALDVNVNTVTNWRRGFTQPDRRNARALARLLKGATR